MTADSPEQTERFAAVRRYMDAAMADRISFSIPAFFAGWDARAAGRAEAVPLFQQGDFLLAGGSRSSWKVECDALTSEDWATLAAMAVERGLAFGGVKGVPRGGIPFADALRPYATTGPVLIADDVLTTGGSILRNMAEHPDSIGLVAFARGPLPVGVQALWTASTAGRAEVEEALEVST